MLTTSVKRRLKTDSTHDGPSEISRRPILFTQLPEAVNNNAEMLC